MARPQVADGGTASDKEGSCEYIVADSRRGVVLQLWGLGEVLTTPPREKTPVKKYSQGEMLPLETKQSESCMGVKLGC